jgi:hypothetical protein
LVQEPLLSQRNTHLVEFVWRVTVAIGWLCSTEALDLITKPRYDGIVGGGVNERHAASR